MTTTDDRIVTAAVRLFVEKGTTQVTISELAQEANVARGTLYRNVGSMDDLFDRVVGEITADLHRRVSASFGAIRHRWLRPEESAWDSSRLRDNAWCWIARRFSVGWPPRASRLIGSG